MSFILKHLDIIQYHLLSGNHNFFIVSSVTKIFTTNIVSLAVNTAGRYCEAWAILRDCHCREIEFSILVVMILLVIMSI